MKQWTLISSGTFRIFSRGHDNWKNLWAACHWPVSAGKPMRRSGQFWQTVWSCEWRLLLCWWERTCRRLSETDGLTILADRLVYWTTDLLSEPARRQLACNRTCFVRAWKCDSMAALLSVVNFSFWLRRWHQCSLFLHLTWGLENIKGVKEFVESGNIQLLATLTLPLGVEVWSLVRGGLHPGQGNS